ncbi:zeta toxin family protein [Streptomyces sp. NPDC058128]|uniref:zeta toxin family protein n=1 Tax=Streptomyces sp. NPDC058128 TaxID=3346352 RepID=UPI0036E0288B
MNDKRDPTSASPRRGADSQQVIAERLPQWTRGAVPQERPVVVFVAGQPGAGKSESRRPDPGCPGTTWWGIPDLL